MQSAINDKKLNTYLHAIERLLATGDATEHSYRLPLQRFLESCYPNLHIINDPKRQACGAPDLVINQNNKTISFTIGFVETKDLGTKLSKEASSEQLIRYREGLNNLVLTNYLDFIWYVRGEEKLSFSLGSIDKKTNKLIRETKTTEIRELGDFFSAFTQGISQPVSGTKELASRMAAVAGLIKRAIQTAFTEDAYGGDLTDQLNSFRTYVLHDLNEEAFADMYAQTICYGLFAARYYSNESSDFSRSSAKLPRTNPFLRWLFKHIGSTDFDERISCYVDELAALLKDTDIKKMLDAFGSTEWKSDPILHFYEHFLSEYDAKLRIKRGVYYTPDPLVKYIVNSVDAIIKNDFKLKDGLADSSKKKIKVNIVPSSRRRHHKPEIKEVHRVNILDPACGTGTFLVEIVKKVKESFKGQEGLWDAYVPDHLLPRIFGFEILMAPYTIAHLKVALAIGGEYTPTQRQRINIILTNTLEKPYPFAGLSLFEKEVADEVNAASVIKMDTPVMVVLGNPPYSASTQNKCEWIEKLMHGEDILNNVKTDDYFSVSGEPLQEKNKKWLNDDYVKFIRFGQWKILRTGSGILAFVTNHMYLQNPTFRGMRESLINSFHDIYLLNLHGNNNLGEKAPDGSVDEGVFEIKQGVCIAVFIRKPHPIKKTRIFYCDVWGKSEEEGIWINHNQDHTNSKFSWLTSHDITNTPWKQIHPKAPNYWFFPLDETGEKEYEAGFPVNKIFIKGSVGIATARNELTIRFDKSEMWDVVKKFSSLAPEQARKNFSLPKDAKDWVVSLAQQDLKDSGPKKNNIIPIAYRPFDNRFTYYTGNSKGFHCRPRSEIMKEFLSSNNIGLLVCRSTKGEKFAHCFVSNTIVDKDFLSTRGNVTSVFPLYIIENENQTPNISKEFIQYLSHNNILISKKTNKEKNEASPKSILGYVYAFLWCPLFQKKYPQFLALDYPKIPIVTSPDLWFKISELGEQLITLHLCETIIASSIKFRGRGDNRVTRVSFNKEKNGQVFINNDQYFEGISVNAWNMFIGGHRVCEKWLKERKDRSLSFSELQDYINIVSRLETTLKIQEQIDTLIANNIY